MNFPYVLGQFLAVVYCLMILGLSSFVILWSVLRSYIFFHNLSVYVSRRKF